VVVNAFSIFLSGENGPNNQDYGGKTSNLLRNDGVLRDRIARERVDPDKWYDHYQIT
jgi:hypothetical protein